MSKETESSWQKTNNPESHGSEASEAEPVWRFADFAQEGDDSPERDKARELLVMWQEAFKRNSSECNQSFHKFFSIELPERYKNLGKPEDIRETLKHAKLFYLLAGASIPRNEFQELPLDLPDGDYEKFIRNLT